MYESIPNELRTMEAGSKRMEPYKRGLLHRAAKAIEELRKQIEELELHYCRHAIHNEHDRGDDSLCRKYGCEVNALPRWIPVTERLPEESEGLNLHEDMMIRFTSVWCCDAKTGTIEVRNRLQGKMTGNEYLDQYTKDTDWHWSKSWWEPTHWMPIVPLPEPPKEDE